jgi:MFS family permease
MSAAVVGDVAPDDMFGKLFGALGGMQGLGVLLGPILGISAPHLHICARASCSRYWVFALACSCA